MTAHARERPIAPGRNDRCGCASGRRYKACCGRLPDAVAGDDAFLRQERWGFLQLREGDYDAALARFRALAERRATPEIVRGLARAIIGLRAAGIPADSRELWLRYVEERAAQVDPSRHLATRVSVIVPSRDRSAHLREALESALRQTRPADEIVVIDDGSSDASPAHIRAFAAREPGRVRAILRGARGIAGTIEEAIRSSTGEWIAILDAEDRFAPTRLATMLEAVAARGDPWGFSRASFIDADGRALAAGQSPIADRLRQCADRIGACDTVGLSLLGGNRATSAGTLFFARALHARAGGFRDIPGSYDWDFCLRASLVAEPAFVAAPTVECRVLGPGFDGRYADAASPATARMRADFVRVAESAVVAGHRYAPIALVWGRIFALRVIEAGLAASLAPATLQRLADECVSGLAS
ncbi:MAG: glycosyltransferase [Betaproteobacteria bacterium]